MAKKSKAKKVVAKEPEVSKEEVLEEILEETPEAEEVLEEILEETPKAEIVEERELPKETGEETTETKMVGGRMMRVIKTSTGVSYIPL